MADQRLAPNLAQQPVSLIQGHYPQPAGQVLGPLGLGATELEPGVGAGVLGQGLGAAQAVAAASVG
jgi:hypothetical protein